MRSWWRNGVAVGMAAGLVAGVAACDPGPEQVGQDLLEELAQGASEDEVYEHLGPGPYEGVDGDDLDFTPRGGYRSSRHILGGQQWMVLYYQPGPDGEQEVSRDTHTPVVIHDGRLDGWGWTHLEELGAEHDVTFPGVDEEDLEDVPG